jgi:hypothetical protein
MPMSSGNRHYNTVHYHRQFNTAEQPREGQNESGIAKRIAKNVKNCSCDDAGVQQANDVVMTLLTHELCVLDALSSLTIKNSISVKKRAHRAERVRVHFHCVDGHLH